MNSDGFNSFLLKSFIQPEEEKEEGRYVITVKHMNSH
jgi:hypothetical protein